MVDKRSHFMYNDFPYETEEDIDLSNWGRVSQHGIWTGRLGVDRGLESISITRRATPESQTSPTDLNKKIEKLSDLCLDLYNIVKDVRIGVGAIHSLNDGEVQLKYPLFYGYQEFDDDVLVSMGDLGVSGVGVTENEAVRELQQRLWMIYENAKHLPPGKVGGTTVNVLRAIRWRIEDAVDA